MRSSTNRRIQKRSELSKQKFQDFNTIVQNLPMTHQNSLWFYKTCPQCFFSLSGTCESKLSFNNLRSGSRPRNLYIYVSYARLGTLPSRKLIICNTSSSSSSYATSMSDLFIKKKCCISVLHLHRHLRLHWQGKKQKNSQKCECHLCRCQREKSIAQHIFEA